VRVKLAAVVVAVAAALGACGSDQPTTTSTSKTTVGSSDTTIGGGLGAAITGLEGITSARCTQTAVALGKAASALPQAFSGVSADMGSAVDELKAFAKSAPSEIRSDLTTLAEGYQQLGTVLADADIKFTPGQQPSAEALQKLQVASEKVDTPDFQAAAKRVGDWFANGCK